MRTQDLSSPGAGQHQAEEKLEKLSVCPFPNVFCKLQVFRVQLKLQLCKDAIATASGQCTGLVLEGIGVWLGDVLRFVLAIMFSQAAQQQFPAGPGQKAAAGGCKQGAHHVCSIACLRQADMPIRRLQKRLQVSAQLQYLEYLF